MSGYKLINGNYITILQPTLGKPTDYKTIGRRNVIFFEEELDKDFDITSWLQILMALKILRIRCCEFD